MADFEFTFIPFEDTDLDEVIDIIDSRLKPERFGATYAAHAFGGRLVVNLELFDLEKGMIALQFLAGELPEQWQVEINQINEM